MPVMRHTIGDIILKSASYLEQHGVDSARIDAELLLAHVLGCDRLRLYMDWKMPLNELELAGMRGLLRERGAGRKPVARILGRKEFYGRDFHVDEATFVPRPETEGVVDRALALLNGDQALEVDRPVVFDACTGSGCIVVSLAAEYGGPRYIASDTSAGALAAARKNARRHKVDERIEFRQGACLAGYGGVIHMLVSNPPYIRLDEREGLPPEVRDHDPEVALFSGADGLDCTRQLLGEAARCLAPGAPVILELGEEQADGAREAFAAVRGFRDFRMEVDLAGRPRYATARWRA